ncbi:MAG TPA: winged helix-turn-helix domain-containing protein [Thermoanaerobaculaceae bacterium]|nr:winged helix-turn-helix domain-containing protein [Thermoanaerobaculaceae bacterium]
MTYMDNLAQAPGKVWHFLRANGKVSLTALEKGVDAPRAMVYMAVGWLAKEGKVEMVQEERAVRIWLRE